MKTVKTEKGVVRLDRGSGNTRSTKRARAVTTSFIVWTASKDVVLIW